jgi:hypothetical protein
MKASLRFMFSEFEHSSEKIDDRHSSHARASSTVARPEGMGAATPSVLHHARASSAVARPERPGAATPPVPHRTGASSRAARPAGMSAVTTSSASLHTEASSSVFRSESTIPVTSPSSSTVFENPSKIVQPRDPRAVLPTPAPSWSAVAVSMTWGPLRSTVLVSPLWAPQQSATPVLPTSPLDWSAVLVSPTLASENSAALVSHTSTAQQSHMMASPISAPAKSAATSLPELDLTQRSVRVDGDTGSRNVSVTSTAKYEADSHEETYQILRLDFVDPGGESRPALRVGPGRIQA